MLVREKRLRLNLNTANFSSRNEEFYQRNQNQLQQQMCKREKKWLNSTKPEEREVRKRLKGTPVSVGVVQRDRKSRSWEEIPRKEKK